MPYHIKKSTDAYEWRGYKGVECATLGIAPDQTYLSFDKAIEDAVKLFVESSRNFDIVLFKNFGYSVVYNTETGEVKP